MSDAPFARPPRVVIFDCTKDFAGAGGAAGATTAYFVEAQRLGSNILGQIHISGALVVRQAGLNSLLRCAE